MVEERVERDLINDDTVVASPNITESLHHWVLRERFPRFVKVTRGRFSQLMSTKKLLVVAVLEENKLIVERENWRLSNLIVFVLDKPESVNSIYLFGKVIIMFFPL